MAAKELKLGQVVYLEWEDSAQTAAHGWVQLRDLVDMGLIRSAGVVVGCSKHQLVISAAVNDQYSPICPLTIPWSCVTKLEVLK